MNWKILGLIIFACLYEFSCAKKVDCSIVLGNNFGKLTAQVTISTIISLARHDLPETDENSCIVDIGCRLITKSQKHADLCGIYQNMKKKHMKMTLDDLETEEIITHLRRRHPDGLPAELKKIWMTTWHNVTFMVSLGVFIFLVLGIGLCLIHRRNMSQIVIKLEDRRVKGEKVKDEERGLKTTSA